MKNGLTVKKPVLMHLKGRHNFGFQEPKRWSKAMMKDAFFEMLERFAKDYKCKVKVFRRKHGELLVLVMHEIGSVDKIIATPIK